jgi:hypothetical protein
MNIQTKNFFIFALIVIVNAYVLNVLFMVNLKNILGKHKNHEVKTLKKSQPIIKGRL